MKKFEIKNASKKFKVELKAEGTGIVLRINNEVILGIHDHGYNFYEKDLKDFYQEED